MVDSKSFQEIFAIPHAVVVRIIVTNRCNLHCTYCDVGCDQPLSRKSKMVFRRTPDVVKAEEVEAFCVALRGKGEQNLHILQGGEITALPVKLVCQQIEILHRFGRRVGLRSNGYNIAGLPPEALAKVEVIHLTQHGNNAEAIERSANHLERHYDGKVIIDESLAHRDTALLVRHGQGTVQQGQECNHLLATLTFVPPVIYPCCNTWAIMHNLNDDSMRQYLVAEGWTIDNPEVGLVLTNWRQTLPRVFFEQMCADSCYLTSSCKPIPMHQIHEDPRDRVVKS